MRSARRRWALVVVVLVTAGALRLVTWSDVFTDRGVRLLGDTDPHYHVLQAERLLGGGLGAVSFDPRLDWPNGADVPWPPLFDATLAGAGVLAALGSPSRAELARAAAVVPPVLGVVTVALSGLLAAALVGFEVSLLAALILGALAAHASVTMLGRPDQHALEILLAAGLWLAFVRSWRASGGRALLRSAAPVGALVALAFWNWLGAAFVLAVPALAVAALHLADLPEARPAARGLAAGSALGAALLAGSIALFGPTGALERTRIVGVGGFHVAAALLAASFAAVLALAPRLRPGGAAPSRRALELALSVALPVGVALSALPGLREGVGRGWVALAAADPWYATISEFQPLLFGGRANLGFELAAALGVFGLAIPAAAAGAAPLLRRWREVPGARAGVLVSAVWAVALLALTLARRRFAPYAALALAAPAAAGLCWLADLVSRRWPVASRWALPALAAVALGPSVISLPGIGGLDEPTIDALTWLREQPSPPDGRAGVAADWDLGHAVQYYAAKPVLTSPFGTEAGPSSMSDWAAIAVARDENAAVEVLARRRIGFLVLSDGLATVANAEGFLPPGVTAPVSIRFDRFAAGHDVTRTAELGRLPLIRLWERDGAASSDAAPALTSFRLLHETGFVTPAGFLPTKKIFGVVLGAQLFVREARPGARIVARVLVRSHSGRSIDWRSAATADASGWAVLRVPYATGPNGTSRATPVQVGDGQALVEVPLAEQAVARGLAVPVSLRPAAMAPGSVPRAR